MRIPHSVLAITVTVTAACGLRADVKPHNLFTDNAVLQQGVEIPVWGTADANENVQVTMTPEGGDGDAVRAKPAAANADGKWKVTLPAMKADGTTWTMTIRGNNTVTVKNVAIGEVWVCSGQSNMEWPLRATATGEQDIAKAGNPNIRLFNVPRLTSITPVENVNTKWTPCTPATVAGFTAVGYYFGRDLQKNLDVPIGLIQSAWGGTPAEAWTSDATLAGNDQLQGMTFGPEKYKPMAEAYLESVEKYVGGARDALEKGEQLTAPPQPPGVGPNRGSTLYNGMIAPLIPFPIKGAIWYQGESNAGRAYQYRTLFSEMIKDWRKNWGGGEFPFLLVQLAPFKAISAEPQESDWAELREAQLLATQQLDNVGMAVITDVGDERDIHPRKKEPVGGRLAIAAQSIAYGQDVTPSGPVYKSVEFKDGKAILTFDQIGGGLVAKGGELTGFTVAGEGQTFVNAQAKIEGDTVVVWSESVPGPTAVRFGWANYPVVNLWNKAGLPASPFRTDSYPGVTWPKKN